MSTARGLPAVALLPTGDVLVAGGLTLPATCTPATASAELYDASSRRWSATAVMATARRAFGDAQLNDGRVLVAGGRPSAGVPLSSAELYDPASETWGAAGSMTTARVGPRLTLLTDGRVLATGGALASGPLASTELFTP
jgi:Galactose oxidase, central domain